MSTTRIRLTAIAWAVALLLLSGMSLTTGQGWADEGLVVGDTTGLQVQSEGVDYEFEYRNVEDYGDGNVYYSNPAIRVNGVASGKVAYDQKTKTLTLDNVNMDKVYLDDCEKLNVRLVGENVGRSSFISDGGEDGCCDVTVIGSGSVSGHVNCGNLTVSGGSIAVSKYKAGSFEDAAIYCGGELTIDGGSISLKECDGKGVYCHGLTLKRGSIIVDDQYDGLSVHVYGGDLVMMGGTLKVTRSYQSAISVESSTTGGETYRGKTSPVVVRGGKMRVTGGSLTAQVNDPVVASAIVADRIYNKVALKSIKGRINAVGAKFSVGGNTYETIKTGSSSYSLYGVSLVKYGAKAAKAELFAAHFGGCAYLINRVEPKAFATKNGAKVTSATFYNGIGKVASNTFSGAGSLKSVRFEGRVSKVCSKAFSGAKKLKGVTFEGGVGTVSTNAFIGAGSLKSVRFEGRVSKVCSKAFSGAKKLKGVTFEGGVGTVSTNAFSGAGSLKSVRFEGRVSKVCSKAFSGAKKLRSVWFDGRVYEVDSNAFAGAKSLREIRLSNLHGIQLEENAFAGTTALMKLKFGDYDKSPFSNVYIYTKKGTKFKTVDWSDNVDISKAAFAKCGKNGGKGLTVSFNGGGVPKDRAKAYRNLFVKYGMPRGFKLQTQGIAWAHQ